MGRLVLEGSLEAAASSPGSWVLLPPLPETLSGGDTARALAPCPTAGEPDEAPEQAAPVPSRFTIQMLEQSLRKRTMRHQAAPLRLREKALEEGCAPSWPGWSISEGERMRAAPVFCPALTSRYPQGKVLLPGSWAFEKV